MDDDRHAGALTDETLERDLARLVAIDPSPEFVARVRTAVANQEPSPSPIAALKGCATFGMRLATRGKWRGAFLARRSAQGAKAAALRWICFAGGPALALIVAAMYLSRSTPPVATAPPLTARAMAAEPVSPPYVAPTLGRRSQTTRRSAALLGPRGGPERPALPGAAPEPLFDARETRALQTLIADVRDQRIDLTPLLRPGEPPPMELPPIADLNISPITIDSIAPADGAQGVRP